MFGLVDGYVLPQNKKPARRITLAIHLSLIVLFPLFIYYLNQWTSIDASPVSPVGNRSLAPNHCKDLSHCRSIWNIVWSCLVTIFSCTWIAVHLNVPCPKKRMANGWIERCLWNPLISSSVVRLCFACTRVCAGMGG